MRDTLPAPPDPRAPPRELLAALRRQIGESAAAECCAKLLSGADPHQLADVLPYLGGGPVPTRYWDDYWPRAWGARGLLYVWTEPVGATVVHGLEDSAWRVAENCLKVSSIRELAAAGPGAVGLAAHRLARVRAQAVRTLGVVGDTEHVRMVDAALDDPDVGVRAAAERAMSRLVERLDLRP